MPPAFNLSQDQTLQFNLCFSDTAIGGHLLKNTDDSFLRRSRFNYLCRRLLLYFEHRDRSLGHITSNAHTYRLLIVKEFCPEALAAILAEPDKSLCLSAAPGGDGTVFRALRHPDFSLSFQRGGEL
jgi:hypothetical protein